VVPLPEGGWCGGGVGWLVSHVVRQVELQKVRSRVRFEGSLGVTSFCFSTGGVSSAEGCRDRVGVGVRQRSRGGGVAAPRLVCEGATAGAVAGCGRSSGSPEVE